MTRAVAMFLYAGVALTPSLVFAQESDARAPESVAVTPEATPEATPEGTDAVDASVAATSEATPEAPAAEEDAEAAPALAAHGTLEAYYAYNFNEPSNGVTANRLYDIRHNMVGLQSAWLSLEWDTGPVKGHFNLQLGALHELFWPGSRSVEEDLLWRLIHEAIAEMRTPWEKLAIEAGVWSAPFGPEYSVVQKNWNWSTSDLFAILPYQLAGIRARVDINDEWTAYLGVFNGWDQIVTDNNSAKSALASVAWADPDDEETYFNFSYMVGNERDRGDPRGPYARHTFDAYGQWHLTAPLSLRAHIFAGLEPGRQVMEGWFAAALSAKVDVTSWFSVVVRGDVVNGRTGAGGANLLHADWLDDPARNTLLGSATLTLDLHPYPFASLRLEARHDRADFPLYYRGVVETDPMGAGAIPNTSNQTTVLLGLTTWF